MSASSSRDPAVATCLHFLRVSANVLAASDACLGRIGLSQSRFGILFLLARADAGQLRPSELAAGIGVPRATMTGLLDGLEREGLIKRVPARDDRRAIAIHLSPKGRAFVSREVPAHCDRLSGMMAALDEAERRALDRILGKLESAVTRMEQAG